MFWNIISAVWPLIGAGNLRRPPLPLSLFLHGSVFRHIFVGASPRLAPQSRKDRLLRKRTKSQKFTQNGSKYINTKDLFLRLPFLFFHLFKSQLVYVAYTVFWVKSLSCKFFARERFFCWSGFPYHHRLSPSSPSRAAARRSPLGWRKEIAIITGHAPPPFVFGDARIISCSRA